MLKVKKKISTPDLTAIILTYNEEKHIKRCILSIRKFVKKIIIIDSYSNDKTIQIAKKYKAKPIFINQLAHNGNHNKDLFILNYSLIEYCKKKKYFCIDLAKSLEGKKQYWWDGVHTTPAGSEAIVKIIYPKLVEFLK